MHSAGGRIASFHRAPGGHAPVVRVRLLCRGICRRLLVAGKHVRAALPQEVRPVAHPGAHFYQGCQRLQQVQGGAVGRCKGVEMAGPAAHGLAPGLECWVRGWRGLQAVRAALRPFAVRLTVIVIIVAVLCRNMMLSRMQYIYPVCVRVLVARMKRHTIQCTAAASGHSVAVSAAQ